MSYGVQNASLFGNASTDGSSGANLRPFANLDLTEDQRKQIRSILQTAKTNGTSESDVESQILAVLTPAQQTTLQNTIAAQSSSANTSNPFSDPNGPFANLDLTSDQQSQIAQILKNGKAQGLTIDQINAQIDTVLTSSQQSTFATDVANLPAPPKAPNAQANVSGQSQDGSGGTSSSSATPSNGVTESSVQNQVAAAMSIIFQQLRDGALKK